MIRFQVGSRETGRRLDAVLAARLGVGRRRVRRLIDAGLVQVDGRRAARPGVQLRAGSWVEVQGVEAGTSLATAGPRPESGASLAVVYEDERFVCVDKPAGMPCVPYSPAEGGTVANRLAAVYPECVRASREAGRPPLEAGLCHRLDNVTSGLLLAARTAEALTLARRAFTERDVTKEYLAIVEGLLEKPTLVDAPLVKVSVHPRKMEARPMADGLDARTEFVPLTTGPALTLVRAIIHTGRPHQIRAHLAYLGLPVLGDRLYGSRLDPERPQEVCLRATGLRSAILDLDLHLPVPEDWERLVRELRP